MKHGIKILYGILILGILISVFHLLSDKGYYALGHIIGTLMITSIVLFLATILFILISFKQNIKKISVWLLLIVSCPTAIISMRYFAKEYFLKITDTTTPDEFLYTVKVDSEKYERDKLKLEKLVDSLVTLEIVQRPSELALRSFKDKVYNDTIERAWAIDLPIRLENNESIIDTLFFSDDGKDVVAGLLINKGFNKFSKKNEYIGNGFEFNKNEWKPFKILEYSVRGYDNYKSCSERLRYYYFKKIGTYENEYNMNDIRFLNLKK